MKTTKEIADLTGRTFGKDEYAALRHEQCLRLEMAYNHGFTLTSIILVFFSAIFVFVGVIFKLALKNESIIGKEISVDSLIVLAIVIFCLFPIFLIYYFSAKYEDNLRQVVSVGAYLRVFYEYPSILNRGKTDKSDTEILGWELFHCNSSVPKAKLISAEYIIISIASFVLGLSIGVALFGCAYLTNEHYYYAENLAASIAVICVFLILFMICLGVSVFTIMKIRKNTKTDTIMRNYSECYFDAYVNLAQEIGFLTEQQAKDLVQLVNNMRVRDKKLQDEFNKKRKK